jgi:hypothetical protein
MILLLSSPGELQLFPRENSQKYFLDVTAGQTKDVVKCHSFACGSLAVSSFSLHSRSIFQNMRWLVGLLLPVIALGKRHEDFNTNATPYPLVFGCQSTANQTYYFNTAPIPQLVYNVTLSDISAEFFSLQFTRFKLPPLDYVRIRRYDDSGPSYTYKGTLTTPFYSTPVMGNKIVIEIYSAGSDDDICAYGFAIEKYRFSGADSGNEAACSANVLSSPVCQKSPSLPYWKAAQAVVRLLIQSDEGVKWCTGWLFGCENHVMTNYHCIPDQATAAMTLFDFRAYGSMCNSACNLAGSCMGPKQVSGATLIASSSSLDYALVKLNTNTPLWQDGKTALYLQMQDFIHVGQVVFIPQHPKGSGMVLGIKAKDTGNGIILTSSYANCGMDSLVGYHIDTLGGSSGSPVISFDSRAVVALHSCGGNILHHISHKTTCAFLYNDDHDIDRMTCCHDKHV